MRIKAVIFDLDGTLLDSISGIAQAMNSMLQEYGLPTHSTKQYKNLVGSGISETIRGALPLSMASLKEEKNNPAFEKMVERYRSIYDIVWPDHSPPFDGIPELLVHLEQHKIKMAVLSNKSDDFTKRMTHQVLKDFSFSVVAGSRPGVPIKPDPTAALEIAQQIKVSPGETIFIGDSGIDMETAVRAGMFPVGALWGFREADELLQHGARELLEHPSEMTRLLKADE